jgi:DNA-binding NtrC family response regulator
VASILVVDDVADVAEVLALALQNAGHEVVSALGAAEARFLLSQQRFDMAIVDLLMPKEAGNGLAKEVKRAGMPVIVTSGHPMAAERLEAMDLPFLRKPFRTAELIALVKEVLAGAGRL